MSLPGRPKGKYRSAKHLACLMSLQRRHFALAGAATLASGCSALAPQQSPAPVVTASATPAGSEAAPAADDPIHALPPELRPPPSPREFRAAWVATVANIDWPSRPGLANAQWRAEATAMLDRAKTLHLNAIVLQVRPAADALYASGIEPWSEYLSGAQGRAPLAARGERVDDPLAFWVAEAHRRGLELHAWFNPYRARHPSAKSPLAAQHIANRQAHAVKRYGDMLWMDPAEPDAAAQTLAVVADVVARYDIDGVHIDDYFYPYPIKASGAAGNPTAEDPELPFPDEPAWQRYRSHGGGSLDRAAWRRERVNHLVQALHHSVHRIKPHVRFGISPFGIGKPALRPAGITGFSQYDRLYADVEHWLGQGWLDYLAPQLYWPMDRKAQAFDVLLDYWLGQNPHQRHIWPGLFTSMVGSPGRGSNTQPWPAAEVLQQIASVRSRGAAADTVPAPGATGHIHFSLIALMQDRDGIATRLRAGAYAQPALVPATPWLSIGSDTTHAAPWLWSLWRRRAGQWRFEVQAGTAPVALGSDDQVVLRRVDRLGRESRTEILGSGL